MDPCPACRGEMPARQSCATCDGMGAIDKPDPRLSPPPEAIECAEALRAWGLIRRYGVEGWMALEEIAPGDLDPDLSSTLSVLDGEYARLEQEARARERRRKK